ncbi:ribose-5-phosphate isomerase RpiA [Alkalicoccus urumqiensis]|uniref:Ribose-5-phosphate isomerase A n=1 Tax=Alkalicoccus urumqiensis TaxID=1548213 RepID=A0A2P6MJX1_ALKUR|nr:ribose-5-phosphate isomerase RpiA [Alkalicoccus urumqiensis]PRO66545.1 ribose 5-phosphate isomerase A [Alkalicoccus urumqiensis]
MSDQQKKNAGEAAAAQIQNHTTIGLGSGSTVTYFLDALGRRILEERLDIRGVSSSEKTTRLAAERGIPLVTFSETASLDTAVDGADEISPSLALIKGGGASLLREKIVIEAARRVLIIADEAKAVSVLGSFPLPVEVVMFGWQQTKAKLEAEGLEPVLRQGENGPLVTDNDNYILDCRTGDVSDPAALHRRLKQLTGVVETGIFPDQADEAILGTPEGTSILQRKG